MRERRCLHSKMPETFVFINNLRRHSLDSIASHNDLKQYGQHVKTLKLSETSGMLTFENVKYQKKEVRKIRLKASKSTGSESIVATVISVPPRYVDLTQSEHAQVSRNLTGANAPRHIAFRVMDSIKSFNSGLSWIVDKLMSNMRSIVASIIQLFRDMSPGQVMLLSGLDDALDSLQQVYPKLMSVGADVLVFLEALDCVLTFVNIINTIGAGGIAYFLLNKIKSVRVELQDLISVFTFHLALARDLEADTSNDTWAALKEVLLNLSRDIAAKMALFSQELTSVTCELDHWRVHGCTSLFSLMTNIGLTFIFPVNVGKLAVNIVTAAIQIGCVFVAKAANHFLDRLNEARGNFSSFHDSLQATATDECVRDCAFEWFEHLHKHHVDTFTYLWSRKAIVAGLKELVAFNFFEEVFGRIKDAIYAVKNAVVNAVKAVGDAIASFWAWLFG